MHTVGHLPPDVLPGHLIFYTTHVPPGFPISMHITSLQSVAPAKSGHESDLDSFPDLIFYQVCQSFLRNAFCPTALQHCGPGFQGICSGGGNCGVDLPSLPTVARAIMVRCRLAQLCTLLSASGSILLCGGIEPNPIVSRACPDSRTSLSSLQHCSLRRPVLAPGLSHHSIASLPQPPGSLQMSATAAGTCLCPPSHFLGSLLSMPISIIPTNTTPSGLQDLRGKELSLFSVFQSLFQSKAPSPEVGQQGCVHRLLGLP